MMLQGGVRAKMRGLEIAGLKPALGTWLIVAIWTAIVLGLGSDSFSHSSTSRILLPLLQWLLPGAEPETLALLLRWIRKTAHVVEYAVLGILAYRALRLSVHLPTLGHLGIATGLVLAVAASDEGRQARSELRSGRLADVGLDATGGLAGAAAGFSLGRLPRTRRWFPAAPRST